MNRKTVLFISLLTLLTSAFAQKVPVVIEGATIHIGNGQVIEKGTLVMQGGKIIFCGLTYDATGKEVKLIKAEGKHVYPGLICMNTYLGLNEIDAVRSTRDYVEAGTINPNARALIAYNTDSKVTPTARFNGILLVQAVPQGGLLSGQSSVMKTNGWNWEDAQYKADDGIHINWPDHLLQNTKENAEKQKPDNPFYELEELFAEAERYARIKNPETVNLRLEAMKGLFTAEKNLYIHTNSTKGIVTAIQFTKKYSGLKLVLVGAASAYKVTGLIRENNIPVVLNQLHRLPQTNFEDIDQPYKTPALLMKEGIKIAIGHSGSWESRNVMFNAGTAAAYGLSKEEALMCITKNAAEIMNIGNRTGTIEVGKDAMVLISTGDILDMRTNNIEFAFINGEEVKIFNHQNELQQKFMDKHGIK